jgi:glycosyltransferase involved in cell wall biosynthesis
MIPLVSILIPAFNAQATLGDTLRSAIGQTWRAKEIIVVNDGSSDATGAVAEGFAPKGVKVVTHSNQGAAAARNEALSLSSGDYVQWLDADDLLVPDKIEHQVRALGRCSDRTVLSGPWGRFWHRPSRAEFRPTSLWCDLSPLEWLLRKMEDNVYMQTATWLVPRCVTEAAGPWDTRLLGDDDGEYFSRVLLSSDRICFVPAAKVLYRMSGCQGLSYVGHSQAKMEAQFLSMRLNIQYLRSLEDSARVRQACIQYLQRWQIAFYPEKPDLVAQAARLARDLGGEIREPRFSWKYAWLAATCGPRVAKRARITMPRIRWSLFARWDKLMAGWSRACLGTRGTTAPDVTAIDLHRDVAARWR